MPTLTPTLHKPVPLQTKVKVPKTYTGGEDEATGRVVGIAMMHVIFTYIVLLDQPLQTEDGLTEAFTIPGSQLMDLDGNYAWRLER
jgi:hypothetical protein